jgi:hypothetical protein
MATATVTVTVNAFPAGVDQTGRFGHLYGSAIGGGGIAIGTGGTYVTDGLPVTWDVPENIYSGNSGNPIYVDMWGLAGFQYVYDSTNNTIRIFQSAGSAAAFAEIANGASVTEDALSFHAVFQRAD